MNERGGCMEIREASFSEKRQIIRQHPHTKSFLKRKGILSVAAKAGRLLGLHLCSAGRLPLSRV